VSVWVGVLVCDAVMAVVCVDVQRSSIVYQLCRTMAIRFLATLFFMNSSCLGL
jgi:hypothetical protein